MNSSDSFANLDAMREVSVKDLEGHLPLKKMRSHKSLSCTSFAVAVILFVGTGCSSAGRSAESSENNRRSHDGFVLNEKDLESVPYTTVDQILIGRIPGARAVSSHMSDVRMRGPHSIRGNNEPMYVVDGIRAAAGARLLNPQNLSRIEVLRGTMAVSRYGSEAVNGVILIETKRAKGSN